jgi:hypothetical protein
LKSIYTKNINFIGGLYLKCETKTKENNISYSSLASSRTDLYQRLLGVAIITTTELQDNVLKTEELSKQEF